MKCPVCGKEVSVGDLFCGDCGARLDEVKAEVPFTVIHDDSDDKAAEIDVFAPFSGAGSVNNAEDGFSKKVEEPKPKIPDISFDSPDFFGGYTPAATESDTSSDTSEQKSEAADDYYVPQEPVVETPVGNTVRKEKKAKAQSGSNNTNKLLGAIIVLLLVIICAGVAYYFGVLDNKGNEGSTDSSYSENEQTIPTAENGIDSMGNVAPETYVDGEILYILPQGGTHLRTAPGLDSIKTTELKRGDEVKVLGTSSGAENWCYVQLQGSSAVGWIERSVVTAEKPSEQKGNVSPDVTGSGSYYYIAPESGITLRTGPGEDYNETTFLAIGEAVKEVGKSSMNSSWVYIEIYNGSGFGWVESSKLSSTNPDSSRKNKYYSYDATYTAQVNDEAGLRLRDEASTSGNIYGVISYKTSMTVIGYSAYDVKWRYVSVYLDGKTQYGFVHSDYIS